MTIKEQVLLLLENHREEFFSGEEIAGMLSVSRAGVWKAVKTLQKEGYAIEAVNNRGYVLRKAPDVLSAAFIGQELAKGPQLLLAGGHRALYEPASSPPGSAPGGGHADHPDCRGGCQSRGGGIGGGIGDQMGERRPDAGQEDFRYSDGRFLLFGGRKAGICGGWDWDQCL